jgi:hypothetical protein
MTDSQLLSTSGADAYAATLEAARKGGRKRNLTEAKKSCTMNIIPKR